jgi:tRNA nucleotidyltransferase (CCA-adding enzyme)
MTELKKVFAYLLKLLPRGKLYAVGGTSRDFLLGRPFDDFDFACSYTPEELKPYLKGSKANFAFAHLGIVDLTFEGHEVTLASFRKESGYSDARHPTHIEFISDPAVDSARRDFTVNAIYLDPELRPFDPQDGIKDLKSKTIRMIGDIPSRIQEDPLRILRAYRFKYALGFEIEKGLESYLEANLGLVYELNPQKIEMELKKFTPEGREKISALLGSNKC